MRAFQRDRKRYLYRSPASVKPFFVFFPFRLSGVALSADLPGLERASATILKSARVKGAAAPCGAWGRGHRLCAEPHFDWTGFDNTGFANALSRVHARNKEFAMTSSQEGLDSLGAVILAAGKGTRMYSDTPKVLQRILEEPMLRYVYDAVAPVCGGNM